MRKTLALGILAAAFLTSALAGCSGKNASTPSAPAGPSPTKKWEIQIAHLAAPNKDGFYDDQSPAIGDDGTIYAGGSLGLYAIRPDGTEKWHHDINGQQAATPVRYVLIDDIGNIWFDDSTNNIGGTVRVTPDGKGGEVGSILPVTQLGSAYDGTVFMGTSASLLQMSISAQNPEVLFRGYATGMAFTADGGMVFTRQVDILSYADKLHSVPWNHKVDQGGNQAPVVSADHIIYLSRSGGMDAYKMDGKRQWAFEFPGGRVHLPSATTERSTSAVMMARFTRFSPAGS